MLCANIDTEHIKLFGRWQSDAMFRYLRVQATANVANYAQRMLDAGAYSFPPPTTTLTEAPPDPLPIQAPPDILAMDNLAGVEFIQGDFTEDAVFEQILEAIGGEPVDLVVSDMAPNMSGMAAVDQPKSMYLVELALDMDFG